MVSGQSSGNSNGESSVTPREPIASVNMADVHAEGRIKMDTLTSNAGSDSNNSNNSCGSLNATTVLAPTNSQHFNKNNYNNNNGNNNNNNNNNNDLQNKNRICRDFLRGQCRRLYCKYPHVQSPDLVVFCHDFQNNKCPRINCKFLHYSIEEEEHYRKYGEFPIDDSYNNSGMDYHDFEYTNNFYGPPPSINDMAPPPPPSVRPSGPPPSMMSSEDSIFGHPCSRLDRMDRGSMFTSSNSYRNEISHFMDRKRMSNDHFINKFKRSREDDIITILRRFEEEHLMLRRRVEANELKIAELRASNEYLMSQNAQLRLSTVQVSRVVNPVTVTNTVTNPQPQSQATQVINAVSMAPVQVATPIVSMATPQTQIITNNGPPLAIAASTSQGQQIAITPQNISTLSTSGQQLGQPTQILGTSQITLAPAALGPSISAPSMGLAINTSTALAISNATQPIISYPIMTHSILPH